MKKILKRLLAGTLIICSLGIACSASTATYPKQPETRPPFTVKTKTDFVSPSKCFNVYSSPDEQYQVALFPIKQGETVRVISYFGNPVTGKEPWYYVESLAPNGKYQRGYMRACDLEPITAYEYKIARDYLNVSGTTKLVADAHVYFHPEKSVAVKSNFIIPKGSKVEILYDYSSSIDKILFVKYKHPDSYYSYGYGYINFTELDYIAGLEK